MELPLSKIPEGGHFQSIIKVRVVRIWDTIIPTSTYNQSFDFLAVDDKNDAIQITMSQLHAYNFKQILREGQMYTIKSFQVTPQKDSYNAVVRTTIILLNKFSEIKPISEDLPSYPKHFFAFASYEKMKQREDDPTFMTDVIGMLVSATQVTPVKLRTGNKMTNKRDVYIKLISGEKVRISIWHDHLDQVDVEALRVLKQKHVIIFAGTTVKSFLDEFHLTTTSATKIHINLDILETFDLMIKYHKEDTGVEIVPQPNQQNLIDEFEEATVAKLMSSVPSIIKDKKFVANIWIKNIDTTRGWYYFACGRCTKAVREIPNGFSCTKHGPRTPQLMLRLTLDLQDETGCMEAIMFGTTAEALTGIMAACLSITTDSKMVELPPQAKTIIGQHFKIVLGLPQQSIEKRELSYKAFQFWKITDQEETTISETKKMTPFSTHKAESSQQTIENTTEQPQPSTARAQIPSDLFQEETPVKGPKFSEESNAKRALNFED